MARVQCYPRCCADTLRQYLLNGINDKWLAGACGNRAILAYSNQARAHRQADLGYVMIFPGMAIVKILFASIVAKVF